MLLLVTIHWNQLTNRMSTRGTVIMILYFFLKFPIAIFSELTKTTWNPISTKALEKNQRYNSLSSTENKP